MVAAREPALTAQRQPDPVSDYRSRILISIHLFERFCFHEMRGGLTASRTSHLMHVKPGGLGPPVGSACPLGRPVANPRMLSPLVGELSVFSTCVRRWFPRPEIRD